MVENNKTICRNIGNQYSSLLCRIYCYTECIYKKYIVHSYDVDNFTLWYVLRDSDYIDLYTGSQLNLMYHDCNYDIRKRSRNRISSSDLQNISFKTKYIRNNVIEHEIYKMKIDRTVLLVIKTDTFCFTFYIPITSFRSP